MKNEPRTKVSDARYVQLGVVGSVEAVGSVEPVEAVEAVGSVRLVEAVAAVEAVGSVESVEAVGGDCMAMTALCGLFTNAKTV